MAVIVVRGRASSARLVVTRASPTGGRDALAAAGGRVGKVVGTDRPTSRSTSRWRHPCPHRHRRRGSHPDRPPARRPQGPVRRRPRRRRHQGRPGEGGRRRRPGRLPDHGPGHPGRRRPEPGPHGRPRRRPARYVPSITINKVCLSGLNAIATADQMIRAGEAEIVVAGGMESMTNAPHLLPKSREGFKYGDTKLVDSMAYDALFDQATQQAMGALTEQCNAAGAQPDPRGAGRVRRPARTRRRPRPGRTASSTTRSCPV